MTIAGLIFDFDGTLLDTETPIFEEWAEEYRRHGQELSISLWGKTIGTHGSVDLAANLAESAGEPIDPHERRLEVRGRVRARLANQGLRRGVKGFLRTAKKAGLSAAIASSSTSGWVEHWVGHHGIGGMFEAICGRDQVAEVKPSPELFLLAAEKLRLPPESCLVFEDSPNGILAAHRAGMRCVAVPNGVTRRLPMPEVEVRLESFAGIALTDVLARLDRAPAIGRPRAASSKSCA